MQHTNTIKLLFCRSLENGAICVGCSVALAVLLLCGLDVGRVRYSLWKVSAFERVLLCFPWGDKWQMRSIVKKNMGLFILINKKTFTVSVLTESVRFSMEKDNVIFSGGTESTGISWLSDGDWIKKSLTNQKQTKKWGVNINTHMPGWDWNDNPVSAWAISGFVLCSLCWLCAGF